MSQCVPQSLPSHRRRYTTVLDDMLFVGAAAPHQGVEQVIDTAAGGEEAHFALHMASASAAFEYAQQASFFSKRPLPTTLLATLMRGFSMGRETAPISFATKQPIDA